MKFQPRGFKRKPTYGNLPLDLRRALDVLAAVNDCSRSFVITTLLARQTGYIRKETDYENYVDKSVNRNRRHSKIRRIK